MEAKKTATVVTEVLEKDELEDQLQLLKVDEFAFDEMNLVEIPFCTLQKQASEKRTISLSPSGDEYLEAVGKKHSLPTSLAEPTVLGLMWLTMDKNKFESPKVTFNLRELVEDYMYPSRFNFYRAGGRLMSAVEGELHRIAATRLHSNRWYDRKADKRVAIDAAIIDSITIRQEGGKNSPRVMEIVWGNKVYDSVRARYTKQFDVKTWLKISQPLDRRLFRWLDRQLYDKSSQPVKSCQVWAKHKMLIQSYKLDIGGRTASNYILSKVSESIKRLNGLNFAVRLTVDNSKPDFAFRFDKISGRTNEVVDEDPTGDLVFEFRKKFHGAKKKGRLREADRRLADQWIKTYGFNKCMWMVNRCLELHRQGPHAKKTIHTFKGLEFYEGAADADFDKDQEERAGQLNLELEQARQKKWQEYEEDLLKQAKETLDLKEIERQAKARAKETAAYAYRHGLAREKLVAAERRKLLLEEMRAMSEKEFMAFENDDELQIALEKRHAGQ